MFYDLEEMRMIFLDYVENDGLRWMNFSWDMVSPEHIIRPKTGSVWRGTRYRGDVVRDEWSNGTTSLRTAKEFAWDHYLNRGLSQEGKRVALYRLRSCDGAISLTKLFGEGRAKNEAEVVMRNAVWEMRDAWTLRD